MDEGSVMDNYKLRIKIGGFEFEAEGPKEEVTTQFNEFKELITSKELIESVSGLGQAKVKEKARDNGIDKNDSLMENNVEKKVKSEFSAENLNLIFTKDKRNIISLRIPPPRSERLHPDAILLLMYRYRQGENVDEVPVTKIKSGLNQSGIKITRIDRAIMSDVREGYVIKTGSGKGGRYRLTNRGVAATERVLRELLEMVA